MEQNPIRYSDLISPDDSIQKLIEQLEKLNEVYASMSEGIKRQAEELAKSLKKVSGATDEGRKSTKEADEDAKRLENSSTASPLPRTI
jgi:methyl-accepting chemotaxis protein